MVKHVVKQFLHHRVQQRTPQLPPYSPKKAIKTTGLAGGFDYLGEGKEQPNRLKDS